MIRAATVRVSSSPFRVLSLPSMTFSATVITGHQLKMLMHHADAQTDGVVGVVHLDGLPFDQDFALGGVIQPIDDVHQRGLARAVFAQAAPKSRLRAA